MSDLDVFLGSAAHLGRPPRVLGLFAHPDDEVFCVGGTIAACAAAGATTAVASLTQGEAGQIRDMSVATRRTLGRVRADELRRSAEALEVDETVCLDLGDGVLEQLALDDVASEVTSIIREFEPDIVVTFGPDGAFGHPDHVISCLATVEAVSAMSAPPRLLHARFPLHEQLLLDALVDWLTSHDQRFIGTKSFGHALKLFADGSSMLGFAADHFYVEWFPAGSFVIEQGEAATELFCILSGSVDVLAENGDGAMIHRASYGAGCFFGEDGLASGQPRNAHVVATDDVTCLVLAPGVIDRSSGRGAGASVVTPTSHPAGPSSEPAGQSEPAAPSDDSFSVDVRGMIDRKVAALAAHRSQYALEPDLFPRSMIERLLGTEHFAAIDTAEFHAQGRGRTELTQSGKPPALRMR